VYVGSYDHKVYALNGKTGAKQWEFETGHYVIASPAIGVDGTVYVGSRDNKVYALDGKTGAKKWAFETGDRVASSPAIGSDGTVYVGSFDNKVYALKSFSFGPADSPWPMFGQNAQRTGRAPSPVADKIKINAVSKTASPFTISFESKSGSTYTIEVSHDLKQWGEIGEAQGTGSSVEFTDWQKALFQRQYFRVKLVE
jgi:hypothetical protein